ncbi:hypothetical protein Ddye_004302 [Dipteronia dyeriana]|uniref:C2H2-type domain-containing protein n=1 Tax=Dipteronia dyeriana TaxID=168575 RepID=A0AAE0CX59_9ROSI|nr:hypothetical protein Ddye_004302 [Dipteronia dyeriana]
MTNNTGSDPEFGFRSSPPNHHQIITTDFVSASSPDAAANLNPNPRKKRSKLIKVDDGSGGGGGVSVSKPKYVKRPDPDAPKITMPCSECGKRFWSMKALFGHMRCHPERQWRGINPPPNLRRTTAGPVSSSFSPPVKEIIMRRSVESMMMMTMEDHEAAASLLMLAYGGGAGTSSSDVGGDQFYTNTSTSECQQNDLNCRFECSSCKKVFGSHQALGGHRASHKNVKGCFAMTTKSSDGCCEGVDDQQDIDGIVVVKENVEDCYDDDDEKKRMEMVVLGGHKCSICLRVFSSGQALGGHKRCHWEKLDEPSIINHDHGLNSLLDLNLPAPVEDVDSASSSYSSVLTLDLRLGL